MPRQDTPPPCKHLWTKGRVVHGRRARCLVQTSSGGHYACLRTQTVLGPDDRLCVPEACTPRRACYVADVPLASRGAEPPDVS